MKPLLLPVFLFFTSIMLSACNSGHESWHYKMTVTVETPEGDISGSAVRVMGNSLNGSLLSQNGNPADVRGEAVVIDLGERGVLFALIDLDSQMEFYATFREPNGNGGATPEAIRYFASLPSGTKAEIGTDIYLRLVTFKDLDDPKSVVLVYDRASCARTTDIEPECGTFNSKVGSYTIVDRFEELFGEGVRLKNITLEITDEPITWGVVDQYLHWIKAIGGTYLHGGNTSRNAPYGLHGGNFVID